MRQCTVSANLVVGAISTVFLKAHVGQGIEVGRLCERNGTWALKDREDGNGYWEVGGEFQEWGIVEVENGGKNECSLCGGPKKESLVQKNWVRV